MRVGARTDQGLVREQNEDAYGYRDVLFVVADGMGGHRAGEIASAIAVETILKMAMTTDEEVIQSNLVDVVNKANQAILTKMTENPDEFDGMGTTVAVLLLADSYAYYTNVGDSRVYHFSNSNLYQLSSDHSLVAELLRNGGITPEEAKSHPQRNVLTRALGIKNQPEVLVQRVEIQMGDKFLLCSDGLTGLIDESILTDYLSSDEEPQVIVDKLVNAAKERGGNDNITIIVIEP